MVHHSKIGRLLTSMRSLPRIGLYAVTGCLLLGAVAWAANFTINGNLIVNGNTTTNGMTANGALSAASITSSGSLTVQQNSTLMKSFKQYILTINNGSPATDSKNMGGWDYCALSTVLFEGIDNGSSDSATCTVTPGSYSSTTSRPTWTLQIGAGSTKIDKVTCAAICLSFSTAVTGN